MNLQRFNCLASSSALGIVTRIFCSFLIVPTVVFVASVQGWAINTNTTIDSQHGPISIVDGINPPTIVNVLENASFHCRECTPVRVWDTSILNVFGGTIDGDDSGIEAHDFSTINVFGGQIDAITAYDSATVNFIDGTIVDEGLDAFGSSTINMSGGTIVDEELRAYESSSVNIFGGTIAGERSNRPRLFYNSEVNAGGSSTVNIFGGTIESCNLFLNDCTWGSLSVTELGTVNIFGFDLEITDGLLTGRLANGTPLNHLVFISDDGRFVVNDQGEPSILDFNRDRNIDVQDLDSLVREIVIVNIPRPNFDITLDGLVDQQDVSKWLSDVANYNGFSEAYLSGDSDLDGLVDSVDLNNLALSWQQESAWWSGGDFNMDGIVSSDDLNELAINWRQSIPMALPVRTQVPEPSALLLAIVGLVLVWRQT